MAGSLLGNGQIESLAKTTTPGYPAPPAPPTSLADHAENHHVRICQLEGEVSQLRDALIRLSAFTGFKG